MNDIEKAASFNAGIVDALEKIALFGAAKKILRSAGKPAPRLGSVKKLPPRTMPPLGGGASTPGGGRMGPTHRY